MESLEARDIEENGRPPEILSDSEVMGHLQDILLWIGNKGKSTSDHIRPVESLISWVAHAVDLSEHPSKIMITIDSSANMVFLALIKA
jgi:hypothetical protein